MDGGQSHFGASLLVLRLAPFEAPCQLGCVGWSVCLSAYNVCVNKHKHACCFSGCVHPGDWSTLTYRQTCTQLGGGVNHVIASLCSVELCILSRQHDNPSFISKSHSDFFSLQVSFIRCSFNVVNCYWLIIHLAMTRWHLPRNQGPQRPPQNLTMLH